VSMTSSTWFSISWLSWNIEYLSFSLVVSMSCHFNSSLVIPVVALKVAQCLSKNWNLSPVDPMSMVGGVTFSHFRVWGGAIAGPGPGGVAGCTTAACVDSSAASTAPRVTVLHGPDAGWVGTVDVWAHTWQCRLLAITVAISLGWLLLLPPCPLQHLHAPFFMAHTSPCLPLPALAPKSPYVLCMWFPFFRCMHDILIQAGLPFATSQIPSILVHSHWSSSDPTHILTTSHLGAFLHHCHLSVAPWHVHHLDCCLSFFLPTHSCFKCFTLASLSINALIAVYECIFIYLCLYIWDIYFTNVYFPWVMALFVWIEKALIKKLFKLETSSCVKNIFFTNSKCDLKMFKKTQKLFFLTSLGPIFNY
jgi:hypothetical protein